MIEETFKRYPEISLAGAPVAAEALFLNQLKHYPSGSPPRPSHRREQRPREQPWRC